MKIILSRKGFDSSSGGIPSPILPSGRLCSLPIPDRSEDSGSVPFSSISCDGFDLGAVVERLSRGRVPADSLAHLDPDLDSNSLEREVGWRPLFGQSGSAQSHLEGMGVGAGDLFLFYGWFRQTELFKGELRYASGSPDIHMLFGWLQVDRVVSAADTGVMPAWARYHPHASRKTHPSKDVVYVSAAQATVDGRDVGVHGAGILGDYSPRLQLTEPGQTRSVWKLPAWFSPRGRNSVLSYHASRGRWEELGEWVRLRTVGRGQEFVLDAEDYPESLLWISRLLGES
ncbi:MAG: hypothetical protein ABIE42_08425 [Candidatus Eisenbacteria bacterium]